MPSIFEPTRTGDETGASGVATASGQPKDCRTCTDFKSWAREQRGVLDVQNNQKTNVRKASTMPPPTTPATSDDIRRPDCPYDKDDLGNSTWGLLHTIAAHYPEKPTVSEARQISTFFQILSNVYPCEICAKDFQSELKVEPINATSQSALSQWLCRLHNKVNLKLGKPEFDCSKVNQRWRDGWIDGSCD